MDNNWTLVPEQVTQATATPLRREPTISCLLLVSLISKLHPAIFINKLFLSHNIKAICPANSASTCANRDSALPFKDEVFPVNLLALHQSCDTPRFFGVASDRVRSSAPAPIIQLFLEPLNGIDIKITNDNLESFSRLCSEFGFCVG
jgi:hypothetical protein